MALGVVAALIVPAGVARAGFPGTNDLSIRVNDPANDTTARDSQYNPIIEKCFDGHIMAVYRDTGSGVSGTHAAGFSTSTDCGLHWSDQGNLPFDDSGDPTLIYDVINHAWLVSTLNPANTAQFNFQPINSNFTLGPSFPFNPNPNPFVNSTDYFHDKPFMDVDNNAGSPFQGRHYFAFTDQTSVSTRDGVNFFYSTNQGQQWFGNRIAPCAHAPRGTIAPNGNIFVSFVNFCTSPPTLQVARSTNGAVSFNTPVDVAQLLTTTCLFGTSTQCTENQYSAPAVDAQGNVYVIYTDPNSPNPSEIYESHSTDLGTTWSIPSLISQNGAAVNYFSPVLSSSPSGLTATFQGVPILLPNTGPPDRKVIIVQKLTTGPSGSVTPGKEVPIVPQIELVPDSQDPGVDPGSVATSRTAIESSGDGLRLAWSDTRFDSNGNLGPPVSPVTSTPSPLHAHQPDVLTTFIPTGDLTATADLEVTQSHFPTSPMIGDTITNTITVTNHGPGNAALASLSGSVSPLGTLMSSTSDNALCTKIANTFGCTMGTMANGDSVTVTTTTVATGAGLITETATAATIATDPNSANDGTPENATVAGSSTSTTYGGAVSVAIPDNDPAGITQTINVPTGFEIVDVNASVRITHTFDGDIRIALESPSGTMVDLTNRRGGSSNNFGSGSQDCSGTSTVFDDEASTSISAGSAPFAGSFIPEGGLSHFDGESTLGDWKLHVADVSNADTGTLYCFQIALTVAPSTVHWGVPAASRREDGGVVSVPVVRTGDLSAATVQYDTTDGTATSPDDFSAVTGGTVSFNAGELTANALLTLIDDPDPEVDETFMLTLSNPSLGTLQPPNDLTFTILDNDSSVAFDNASTSTAEVATTINVPLTRVGATGLAQTVDVARSGTATPGSDYTGGTGTVTFPAGSTSATVPITIINDTAPENAETIVLTISNPSSGMSIVSPSVHTITIPANDKIYRPDEWIKISGFSYIGAGIYSTTGSNQTKTAGARRGTKAVFYVVAQNHGNVGDSFDVRGGGGSYYFPVRFFYNTSATDITYAVTHGTYHFYGLAPLSTRIIRVEMYVRSTAPVGSSRASAITLTSRTMTSVRDVVKSVVVAKP